MDGPSHVNGSVYDLVGIGFGPSNLALAVALHEHNQSVPATERLTYRFVERQSAFAWHSGMLIEGTTMQISFLKDLATLRNPTSEFSFVSYLYAKNRLLAFTNHQCLFPSRVEFHDYLEWAASKVDHGVVYGYEVTDTRPAADDCDITELEVTARQAETGHQASWRARNIVLATGLTPFLPPGVTAGARVWHSEDLLRNLSDVRLPAEPTFVVVGAGQSAAEAVECLHRRYPGSHVHSVFSRYGFSPADDSPFVNAIFDPAAVDVFFNASSRVKEALLAYHSNTNYSVVDGELIEDLYTRHYQETVTGERRLHFHRMSRVMDLRAADDHVDVAVAFLPTGEIEHVRGDVVVYATGYRPTDPTQALGTASSLCKRDAEDRLRVNLDYRVDTTDSTTCGIYLQGATEHIHGLSSSLLSNAAVRAGQIVRSIAERRRLARSR